MINGKEYFVTNTSLERLASINAVQAVANSKSMELNVLKEQLTQEKGKYLSLKKEIIDYNERLRQVLLFRSVKILDANYDLIRSDLDETSKVLNEKLKFRVESVPSTSTLNGFDKKTLKHQYISLVKLNGRLDVVADSLYTFLEKYC